MNHALPDALSGALDAMLLPMAIVLMAVGFGWLVVLTFRKSMRF